MKTAISIYLGGQTVEASNANYKTALNLGIACPFCKESVYLVKAHDRQGVTIAAAWRHYKLSTQSSYCESRSLSKEGKAELKALQRPAHNQRLRLFNRRFWDIFKAGKAIPSNPKGLCLLIFGEGFIDEMISHCHERWIVPQILKALPSATEWKVKLSDAENAVHQHPRLKDADEALLREIIGDLKSVNLSVLRYKILCEVIEWLGTKTAADAFGKLVCLSFLDCIDHLPPPIRSQKIAETILFRLILTDWEKAIESLDDKSRAIGFG